MGSISGRNKRPRLGARRGGACRSLEGRGRRGVESAISILLLTLLLLIGLGVFIRQLDMDMGRFGIDTTTAGPLDEGEYPFQIKPKEKL